jgi:hypothetical protein
MFNIGHDFYRPCAPIVTNNLRLNDMELFREKFFVKNTKSGRGE